jgi:ssDNA-binding Zn-finger/Zn-ribbon topoisomerase 1
MPHVSNDVGRIVATGRRCGDCRSPMLRRETRRGFAWICTNGRCGAMVSGEPARGRVGPREWTHRVEGL